MNHKLIITSLLAVSTLVLAGCIGGSSTSSNDNIALAECLTSQGVAMYGTNRCQHCNNQKKAFGYEAFAKINFVDCDKQANLCQLEGVQGYPTWKFADGSALAGEQLLETLATQAGCNLDTPSEVVENTVEIVEEVVADTTT